MRVLVLGIGNVMFGDEGVGVHFVKMMERNYKFSPKPSVKFDFVSGVDLNLSGENSGASDVKFDGSKFECKAKGFEFKRKFDDGREVEGVKFERESDPFQKNGGVKFDVSNLSAASLKFVAESSNLSENAGDFSLRDGDKFDAENAPLELKFIDGGTLAIALTPIIAWADVLIVADCISADGAETGDVYFFGYEQMPPAVSWNGSAHEVEMLETLRLMELAGDLPQTKILGIVPKRIEPMSFELSAEAREGVNLMEKTLLSELSRLGFSYEKIANFSAPDIALEFSKKGAI